MHLTQTRHKPFLYFLSTLLLCCAILLLGSISDAAAQQRSEAWKERAQRSRQQYEQYMERRRDQIRAFAREQKKEFQAMIEQARQAGIPRRLKNDAGETVAVLYALPETGPPTYVSSDNEQSAEIINTKQLWQSSFSDWQLTGQNQDIGIWEPSGRPLESHQEFESLGNSRVQYVDDDESAAPDSHATHVAGTMIAEGVKDKSHGMASAAEVYAWESPDDTGEMSDASFDGTVQLSNHSYGPFRGWENLKNGPKGKGWYWWGADNVNPDEDFRFGFYTETARDWDEVVHNNVYYLPVTSAGNDRGDGPSSQPVLHYFKFTPTGNWQGPIQDIRPLDCSQGTTGYDCLAGPAVAKNPIVVGALKDDGTTPADFSAFGPTDDGRIKPDLTANGVSVYSSVIGSNSSYGTKTGTSMAAPAVTGSIALLKELLGTAEYRASTLKAILLHTADDEIGPKSGPDYKTGWGRMDSERAAEVIEAEVTATDTLHVIDQVTLDEGETQEFEVVATDASEPLRATIAWTDPAGSPPSDQVDPTDKMLVNDLNLRVINNSTGETTKPYVLDPSNPGSQTVTRGDNERDNVEQVYIPDPALADTFTVRISHDGSLDLATQDFGLVVTGNSSLTVPGGGDDGDDDPPGGGEDNCSNTTLRSEIKNDTTIDKFCTVYGTTRVTNGATLTLTSGAHLAFTSGGADGRSELIVESGTKLLVEGSETDSVKFTDAGGCPACDEPIYWGGVTVRGDSSVFEYAKFLRAGDPNHQGTGRRPALLIEAKEVAVKNVSFRKNEGWAIEADQAPDESGNSFTITNSTIKNNYKGIQAFYADATITGTTIKNNDLTAATLWGDFVDFTNNTVTGNGFTGLGVTLNGGNAIIKNNTFTDNDGQGVSISATDVYTFEKNTVKNNTGEGVSVINTSYVYMDGNSKNSVLYNGSHEISSPSEFAHLYLGDASINEGGYNDIYDNSYGSGNRYVYNGVWNDGATAPEIKAEKNNWNAVPASGMFEGPVDYEPYVAPPLEVSVFCMPPGPGDNTVSCTATATGGGGDYNYDWNIYGCDGSSSCSAPCGGTDVTVTVTSANGETATASTTTADCIGGCDDQIICRLDLDRLQEGYAGVDRRALRERINALSGALSDHREASGSARRLSRLYHLLLLEAKVEHVRGMEAGEFVEDPDAPHAFSGGRSEARSLFAERASELETSDPQALSAAERSAAEVALKVQIQDLLRRGRSQEALRKIETYRSSVDVSTETHVGLYQLAGSAYQQQGQYDEALRAINDARAAAADVAKTEARNAYLSALTPVRRGMQELAGQATTKKSATTSSAKSKASSQLGTDTTAVDASAQSLPQEFGLDAPYPNPTRSTASIPLALPERAHVRAAVYDVLGRRVEVLANRSFSAGRPDVRFSTERLSGGLYLVRVKMTSSSGEKHVFTEKVTVVK